MITLSGQMGVLVMVIDGAVLVGFDRAEIAKKLGLEEENHWHDLAASLLESQESRSRSTRGFVA